MTRLFEYIKKQKKQYNIDIQFDISTHIESVQCNINFSDTENRIWFETIKFDEFDEDTLIGMLGVAINNREEFFKLEKYCWEKSSELALKLLGDKNEK